MALLRAKATITRSQVAMTEQLRGILRRATDMPCYMHEKLLQLDDFYCRLLRESLININININMSIFALML